MAATWQTLNACYTNVRSLLNKDSNTLPDATLLPWANKYYYQIIRELVETNQKIYGEISTADLVANQSEYVLPEDDTASTYGGGSIDILRVEVSHDGSNWYVAEENDLQNQPNSIIYSASTGPSIATVNQDYDTNQPRYAFFDRSIFLLPIPTAARTGGLRIFYIKRPNELSSSSSVPDLPKDWLYILAEGMLIDGYRKFGRANEATLTYQKFQQMLVDMRKKEYRETKEVKLTPDLDINDFI